MSLPASANWAGELFFAHQPVWLPNNEIAEEVGSDWIPKNIPTLLGCPWKLVTIVSKLVYNLLTGLTNLLIITYRGYNPFTIYLLSTTDIPCSIHILKHQTSGMNYSPGRLDRWRLVVIFFPPLIFPMSIVCVFCFFRWIFVQTFLHLFCLN